MRIGSLARSLRPIQGIGLACVLVSPGLIKAANAPPTVRFVYPAADGTYFPDNASVRLQVKAEDSDGSIQKIRFYSGTNLLSIQTNAPYWGAWQTPYFMASQGVEPFQLSAVAVDNEGAESQAAIKDVFVRWIFQPRPIVDFVSPKPGSVIPFGTDFEFTVDPKVTVDPIDSVGSDRFRYYVGDQEYRSSPESPYSIVVRNLPEGEHVLRASLVGTSFANFCECPWNIRIQVARVGITSAGFNEEGRFELAGFSVLETPTLVQWSSNLADWITVQTNSVPSSTINFVDEEAGNTGPRYYRLATDIAAP